MEDDGKEGSRLDDRLERGDAQIRNDKIQKEGERVQEAQIFVQEKRMSGKSVNKENSVGLVKSMSEECKVSEACGEGEGVSTESLMKIDVTSFNQVNMRVRLTELGQNVLTESNIGRGIG